MQFFSQNCSLHGSRLRSPNSFPQVDVFCEHSCLNPYFSSLFIQFVMSLFYLKLKETLKVFCLGLYHLVNDIKIVDCKFLVQSWKNYGITI